MAASAADRAVTCLILGGDVCAPCLSSALDVPTASVALSGEWAPCLLRQEAWPATASGEEHPPLHRQLNGMSASVAAALVVAGDRHRRIRLTGRDARLLAVGVPQDPEDVLR